MENKYVDNDVWVYQISLKKNSINKTIYTKPLPNYYELDESEQNKYTNSYYYYDCLADKVKEKYFTKERIQELKEMFIKQIRESENPFNIFCIDTDGGYNVTEEKLFSLD